MTKSIADYEAEIKELHYDLMIKPNSKELKKKKSYRLGRWADLLDIAVRVASNETKPWTEDEIGLVTLPMAKKSMNGFDQVGDYQFEVHRENEGIITGGLVIERKEVSDFYGTLMNEAKRARFKREIDRYKTDSRFDLMVIMVEGSLDDFMSSVPEVYAFQLDQVPGKGTDKLAEYLKRYYKIDGVNSSNTYKPEGKSEINIDTGTHLVRLELHYNNTIDLYIDRILRDTLIIKKLYGKPAVYQVKGASKESKVATTANLFIKNTPISWCVSREMAIKLYRQMIRQWCIEHYDTILKL